MTIIEKTHGKVQSYLRVLFGDRYEHLVSEVDGTFVISQGSAVVTVSVKPWHEDDCIIEALSYVVAGATMNETLMNFLLRENSRTPFGGFGVSFDNTITFSHSLTGANLDQNELSTTVRHVGFMADHYDDIIRSMAGGMRAVDGGALLLSDAPTAAVMKTPARKIAPKKKPVPKKKPAPKKKPVPKKKPAPRRKPAAPRTVTKKAAKKVTAGKIRTSVSRKAGRR